MDAEFWHKAWSEDRTRFHQERVNSRLQRLWPHIVTQPGSTVFVPLCGKSQDMLWLQQQGHAVIGVELSEKAVQAFFNENGLQFKSAAQDNYAVYTSVGDGPEIRLYAGDLFELKYKQLQDVTTFYDRASLIALPPDMRQRYADKMAELMPENATGLLISMSYDPSKMTGPPFSVQAGEVERLFQGNFSLTQLDSSSGPERLGNLADRGLDTMVENVFRLHRLATGAESPADNPSA